MHCTIKVSERNSSFNAMSKYKMKGIPNSLPAAEVNSARNKLEDLLQTLVERKDDSAAVATGSETTEVESASSTPPRRGQFVPRIHRKRKKLTQLDVEPEMEQHYHHTYIMKLFERSVDLAQFSEDTPLYPICRAWIRNQPHNRRLGPRERSPTPRPDNSFDEDDEGELGGIYELPPPTEIKSEFGEYSYDMRIPSPYISADMDVKNSPSPEQLLMSHMTRWKQIRLRWMEASRRNEARYASSFGILKVMHNTHRNDK